MTILILGTSIVLQIIAAILAIRLLRTTGFLGAWLCIGSALSLMAARRSITLYDMMSVESSRVFNLPAELTALLISVLMLCGVFLIRPIILSFRKTEENLRKSEAIYKSVLDNMTDTFYRTDKEGRIVLGSKSVEQLLGYPIEELIGKSLSGLYVDPADREIFLEKLAKEGHVEEFEILLQHRDGTHVLVESNAYILTDDRGVTKGVEGIVRNITQSRQAEKLNARLGRIIEDSVNEVYIFDGESLKFTLVNRGARRNLGYSMKELSRLTPVDLQGEFNLAEFAELLQPLQDANEEVVDFETEYTRKNGSSYPVEIQLQYARAEDPPLFFAIVQDISERKQAEEQLSQAHKMEAVGQLTGGIAHDFNNLLTVIQGNIELAMLDENGQAERYLGDALTATGKSATLTQRLLAFSRKQALKPEIVDIRALFAGMHDLLERTLRENVQIEFVNAARLWRCEVDPGQLENVLLNLAINAQDAMPDGGKLTIETANAVLDEQFAFEHIECTPGQYVFLAVSDSGTGMASNVLSQVFEPFFTTKEEGKGSGLGLSMVYGFVKQSGGSIDIYSEIGEGTTVKIYLPRAHGIPDEIKPSENDTEERRGDGETIVIVEDNPDLGRVVTRMLSSLGYRPLYASDVRGAIALFEKNKHVDLLLTDVILKGIEKGTDLAEIITERWPETVILFMSGYTENAIIHDGRLDVGVELLPKPFSKQKLANKIAQLLASSKTLRKDS